MATSTEPARRRGTADLRWWRHAVTARVVLAGTFVAILLGAVCASFDGGRLIASLAGFATALTLVAAAVISWENVVEDAQLTGLVEPNHDGD